MNGLFISLEGPDGCGKTTAVKFIKEYLEAKGCEVLTTREPGGTVVGEQIRSLVFANPVTPLAEILLFSAARAEHIANIIKPALAAGVYVICDRYVDSTMAYQGYGRKCIREVGIINDLVVNDCMPDITFFFDLPFKQSLQRALARSLATDVFEQADIEFKERVFEGYQALLNTRRPSTLRRLNVIDASVSIEEVQQQLARALSVVGNKESSTMNYSAEMKKFYTADNI